jgi:hypothetical protein
MGAGRKLTTYTRDTSKEDPCDEWRKMQRNLGESLGACIFGNPLCLADKLLNISEILVLAVSVTVIGFEANTWVVI